MLRPNTNALALPRGAAARVPTPPHGVPLVGLKEVHTTRTFLRVSLNQSAMVL